MKSGGTSLGSSMEVPCLTAKQCPSPEAKTAAQNLGLGSDLACDCNLSMYGQNYL